LELSLLVIAENRLSAIESAINGAIKQRFYGGWGQEKKARKNTSLGLWGFNE
jgi:hypothetical protein